VVIRKRNGLRTIIAGIILLFAVTFFFSSSFSFAAMRSDPTLHSRLALQMHAGVHITRGTHVDPRVAAYNQELAAYKQSVAALKRDVKHLKAQEHRLDAIVKDLNGSAQMDMINLQSRMSNRQTAVQLSTNLIKALGDAQREIIQNIKR
jgi:cell division protein FtsB